jgi:hypothetical protein
MGFRDVAAILVGAVLFVLVALLWYVRPSPALWLVGSLLWAGVAYPLFFWYITREN